MWRNYLLVTWRGIKKNKGFTAINVIGLSLSMSICLLLILLVHDHLTHDNFHPAGDRTYRVISFPKGERNFFELGYATSPLPVARQFSEEFEMVENYSNLNHVLRGELETKYQILNQEDISGKRSLFADERFFEVFGFELLEGDEETALKQPFSMVLSEEMASLLFPKGDHMNGIVNVKDKGSYTVTGVARDIEGKSHIRFNILASFSSIPLLVNDGLFKDTYDDWETQWMNYNYLVLKEGASPSEAQQIINKLGDQYTTVEEGELGYEYELQPITEIVPSRMLSNELANTLPRFILVFFAFLGLIVIITASINYTNLSIAKSLTRVKEIGIRKSNGATRGQIILQFIIESVIISLISLVFAVFIYRNLIEQFNTIYIFSLIGLSLEDTIYAYGFFLVFSLSLGALCGAGPAMYISRLDTVMALRGGIVDINTVKRSFLKRLFSKQALLSLQFGLSIILLITIFLVQSQADHLTNMSFGFADEKLYFMELQNHEPDRIAQEFSQIPGIESVTFASHHPAVGRSYSVDLKRDTLEEPLELYYFYVDSKYVDVMELEIIAGNDFPETIIGDQEKFVLLNETAVKRLGYGTPNEAVNEIVVLNDDRRVTILGVVKDYHWEQLMKSIQPLALRIKSDAYKMAYFNISGSDKATINQKMEDKWSELDPNRTYKGGFLSEETDHFYQFLYDLGSILTLVSVIAISITGLGFLGMVSFHLQTRTKEIGIRKVLGASFGSITYSMTKGFLVMLGITSLIAIPLSIVINSLWINQMAVHAPISIMNVGPAILILIIIVGVTLISQVWKNTSNNPVEALRSE
ncbi:MAG: ABC transporter permease [Cyclobacteriaceae bacterium]